MKGNDTLYFNTNKAENLLGTKKIEASDNLMRKMSDLNVDWDHLLWELINNSIQAAEERYLDCIIDLDFIFDEDDPHLLKALSIRDQSGGIPYSNIEKCMQPAKRISKVTTLNEHGMGLNTAIEYFTTNGASYRLESHHAEQSYYTDEIISFHTPLKFFHLEPEDWKGTRITFNNLSDQTNLKYPHRHLMEAHQFWVATCAKYRLKHEYFTQTMGRKFEINMNFYKGENVITRSYSPLTQVLINPLTGKDEWVTSFVLSEGEGENLVEIEYRLGAAALEKSDYHIDMEDNTVPYQMHPYRVATQTYGFDLIYQSIVMSFLDKELVFDLTDMASNGETWAEYSALRGEIIVRKGMTSFFVKNGLKKNLLFNSLNEKAKKILTGDEPHPVSGEKIDFMRSYIHRKVSSSSSTAPEDVIKYRLRNNLETYANCKVTQEESGVFGRIDLLIEYPQGNKEIIEVKKKKTKPDDVLQTFKYLLFKKDVKIGKLMAPEHSDDCVTMAHEINELLNQNNQKIVLEVLNEQLVNPNLTESEKKILEK